jgi:pyrroloquinoline quinone biosynthesis protein B
MHIIVLGSAAGGGFPQWNSACAVGARAWRRDPAARWRTQCSLAISADNERWVLLNASPDLRQQILATPALHPRAAPRHSPIAAVVLTNGDIDHVAGLLTMRESHAFDLHATGAILEVLAANPMFDALNPAYVQRRRMRLDEPIAVAGLAITPFAVPGKVALYLERGEPVIGESETTVGLAVRAGDARFFFVPGCARVTNQLAARLEGAPLLFFDGTLWTDDEMVRSGTGTKTGTRMGHISVFGSDGSLAALAPVNVGRKIYIHINNTNPMLLEESPERAAVTRAGWEVAHDGMEVRL